jgi:flagellar biosynthesis GTPase FlhF
MPLRQTTFTLISLPGQDGPPRPPMTSKAAKKAHCERQRLKISKEELRRQTQAELRKIKHEQENEKEVARNKARNCAKAARERKQKKKVKGREAQKQAKKKAGKLEQSRHGMPGQMSIKAFMSHQAGSRGQKHNRISHGKSPTHQESNACDSMSIQAGEAVVLDSSS